MMECKKIWISGNSQQGKTTTLAEKITQLHGVNNNPSSLREKPLILGINYQGIKHLREKLLTLNPRLNYGRIRTPFGLMIEDVTLFYPLICEKLGLNVCLPFRLRPETEQELATQLWHNHLSPELLSIFGGEYNCVRRILDFMALATAAGINSAAIPSCLKQSPFRDAFPCESMIDKIGELILSWRSWCLERGLLSYGLIYELFGDCLLSSSLYQNYLINSYSGIFVDDIDDFPAVMVGLCKLFLNHDKNSVFTFNNTGKVRLGLNADPDYIFQELFCFCDQENLSELDLNSAQLKLDDILLSYLNSNVVLSEKLPSRVKAIVTDTRSDLLKSVVDFILKSIKNREVKPDDIVIIAPGLDEIARYTFLEYFTSHNIKIRFLHEQKPLITQPIIRSILTLITFLYPNLGRLIHQSAIAEMLVILSGEKIDLVRGNLLVDNCYFADLVNPLLLPADSFSRWDRLSYDSLLAYENIREWLKQTQGKIMENKLNFLGVMDKIITDFFPPSEVLTQNQLLTLKEFQETALHFWQIQQQLNHHNLTEILTQFITLLRKGTITGNPLILEEKTPEGENSPYQAITISSIYQYRAYRGCHLWQFWLDSSSPYWGLTQQLFGASAFLHPQKSSLCININDNQVRSNPVKGMSVESEEETIQRIIRDLSARSKEKIFLCHSNLSIDGIEQTGKLRNLINKAELVD